MVAGVPDFSITVVLGQGSGGNPDPNPPYPTWAVWVMAQALSKPFVYGVATAPPPQFGASSPLPAPSNGRNCTPAPATSGHYVTAAGQAAKMSAGCFSGLGPAQCTFGSGSAVSQVMAQSAQFQDVLGQYYMLGRTSGWQNFGAAGYATAGSNPVAQFPGSFGWKIAPASGGLNLTIAIQAVSE
jgi:hypothetical protein